MEIEVIKFNANHKKKFAIVKLWPGINNAESECTARLKLTARSLGLECIEITSSGYRVDNGEKVNNTEVDFAIHLHFLTPKSYDIFSFVALWNPLQFYHDWGYQKFSRHLLTHDDFLSCDSPVADDHINRWICNDSLHLSPSLTIFHSLSTPIISPTLKERKLFYIGINWEALNKGVGRHKAILKALDKTGLLSIYGPEIFLNVRIWHGYNSYVKEIPFDGTSIIHEIAKVGAVLVLSSDAHKESGLMSNRLFEGLAAGAIIICDENPFAKKHFGDTLLYVNTKQPNISEQIIHHIEWMNKNKKKALQLALSSQKIFLEKFSLSYSLSNIYHSLERRKTELAFGLNPKDILNPKVKVFYFLLQEDTRYVKDCIESCTCQDYSNKDIIIIIPARSSVRTLIAKQLKAFNLKFSFIEIEDINAKSMYSMGEIISIAIKKIMLEPFEYFMVMVSGEEIFSNHISSLIRLMKLHPDKLVSSTAALLKHGEENDPVFDVQNSTSFGSEISTMPIGFAKFMISKKLIHNDVFCLLPYLNKKALLAFIGKHQIVTSFLATVIIDIKANVFNFYIDHHRENNIINDVFTGMLQHNDINIPHENVFSKYCRKQKTLFLNFFKEKLKHKAMPRWLKHSLIKIYIYLK